MGKKSRQKNRSRGLILAQGPEKKLNKLGQVATHTSVKTMEKLVGVASEHRSRDAVGIIARDRSDKEALGIVRAAETLRDTVADEEESWTRRTLEKGETSRWEVLREENPDPRQVAVQFYLSMLASCVSDGINLQAASNQFGQPYPQCAQHWPIAHMAVHNMEHSASEPLDDDDKKTLTEMLNTYIGRMFFRQLKAARIFQFKQRDFGAVYHLADMHVTNACGYKWVPGDRKPNVPEEEARRVAEYTVEEGLKVPFPEKLPFSSCYLAWGTGVVPSRVQCFQYGLDPNNLNLIMGTLIDELGWAFTIVLKGKADTVGFAISHDQRILGGMRALVILERIGESVHAHEQHVHIDGTKGDHERMLNAGWVLPYSLAPWMIVYAIDSVDHNDSLIRVQPGLLKERMRFMQFSKRTKQRFVPAPYYTVLIQPTTYDEIETRIKSRPKAWSHQWDVRGHYGHKVMRGTLPIDPKLIHQLHKRKYEIFHALNRPHGEALALLMRKRVMPPREGEWLAYLKFHRDAFIKGPKDKPYIPSVHKLKRGLPEI